MPRRYTSIDVDDLLSHTALAKCFDHPLRWMDSVERGLTALSRNNHSAQVSKHRQWRHASGWVRGASLYIHYHLVSFCQNDHNLVLLTSKCGSCLLSGPGIANVPFNGTSNCYLPHTCPLKKRVPVLTMLVNRLQGFFEGQGGAIFTSGKIVVNGESSFSDNRSAVSGAEQ